MATTTTQAKRQWRVMISSRMVNFEPERVTAQRAIEAAGMNPWSFENRQRSSPTLPRRTPCVRAWRSSATFFS